ncbi:Hsp70 family protein [Corynebacterium suedekumii]|nr:Hsp70 family protein [Corynebacterium suedekumii]
MADTWHLAVDFGTSNSSAAHTAPMSGTVEAVALSHRSNLMPSAVFVDGDGEARTILTGDTALSRGRRDPSNLLPSPKRYIDHDDVQLAGRAVSLVEVVGSVFTGILERARAQHAGQDPESVTLTHPEGWSVHSVDQLVAAVEHAGVPRDHIRLISEPRAAAIHYAAQQTVTPGEHVAVFDFGGGTLDIAVLEAEKDGNFRVVAAKGDNSLGGRTVDNLLYRWVISQVEHDDPDLADYLRNAPVSVMHSLDVNIRDAKEILSDTSSATITVSTPNGEHDLLITRDEFNEVIARSVDRACELTLAALEQAGVNQSTTPIYMTGGSSRIPYMQNRLGEIGTVMTLDDPKTVVSRGALAATLLGFTTTADGKAGPTRTAGAGQTGGNPFASGGPAAASAAGGPAAAGAAGAAAADASTDGNPFAAGAPGAGAAGAPGAPSDQPAQQTAAVPTTDAGAGYGTPGAAGGATGGSVPSSHSTSSGGSPAKLLGIGGAIGAVVVVGGLLWFFLGGDDEGENTATEETTTQEATEPTTDAQETSAAAAPTSAAAPTAAANGGIPEYSSLVERVPEAQGALPAPFLATVQRGCTVTEPISSFIEGLGEEVIQCNGPSGEAAEAHPGQRHVPRLPFRLHRRPGADGPGLPVQQCRLQRGDHPGSRRR